MRESEVTVAFILLCRTDANPTWKIPRTSGTLAITTPEPLQGMLLPEVDWEMRAPSFSSRPIEFFWHMRQNMYYPHSWQYKYSNGNKDSFPLGKRKAYNPMGIELCMISGLPELEITPLKKNEACACRRKW